jgi:hypothetical protein
MIRLLLLLGSVALLIGAAADLIHRYAAVTSSFIQRGLL